MSVDKSLVSRVSMTRARNVYTRSERLEILKKEGRLKYAGQVLGLPKTRVEKVLKKVKAPKEKKAEEGAAAAPGAAASTAAAGAAAGAKPAAAGAKPSAAAPAAPAAKAAEKKPAKK
jgi:small basic protein (TIGR04137 family)